MQWHTLSKLVSKCACRPVAAY